MALKLLPLDDWRIPGQPEPPPPLDGQSLHVIDVESFAEETNPSDLTAAIGLATVLYNWCPEALYAFLDRDAWFSFTWTLTMQHGEPDETKLEIGRIRNQVTFGSLEKEGLWKLMITYDISHLTHGPGVWVPNVKETMLDDGDVTDPSEIDRLARDFVRDLILQRRWLTGGKMRHDFFIEYAPMDVWGDGIAMNPHWLYAALDLTECTTCHIGTKEGRGKLNRCGKCGTAAYCSSECQRKDWPVHKAICGMSMEDRGTTLHLTRNGGLLGWMTVEAIEEDEGDGEE